MEQVSVFQRWVYGLRTHKVTEKLWSGRADSSKKSQMRGAICCLLKRTNLSKIHNWTRQAHKWLSHEWVSRQANSTVLFCLWASVSLCPGTLCSIWPSQRTAGAGNHHIDIVSVFFCPIYKSQPDSWVLCREKWPFIQEKQFVSAPCAPWICQVHIFAKALIFFS